VSCQVEVSAMGWSLVQRSPTECGVSKKCDREASKKWGGAAEPLKNKAKVFLTAKLYIRIGICKLIFLNDPLTSSAEPKLFGSNRPFMFTEWRLNLSEKNKLHAYCNWREYRLGFNRV
jgi:hypothetical protein